MVTSRPYQDADDALEMQALIQETWTPTSHWHIGDLAWQRWHLDGDHAWSTRIWNADEVIAGWGWIEQPNSLNLVVAPQHTELADPILDWFEREAEGGALEVTLLETEAHLITALARRGYHPDPTAAYFLRMVHDLDPVPTPTLAPGYRARSVSGSVDLHQRVAVHQAAWNPTPVTSRSLQRVMQATPYRPALDWVVAAPDGRFVASCLLWLDARHRVCLMEPVGTHPDFRRQGLARAVCLYAMQAAKAAGATHVIVNPRGDGGYPIPRQLYEQIGFHTRARTHTYRKAREP